MERYAQRFLACETQFMDFQQQLQANSISNNSKIFIFHKSCKTFLTPKWTSQCTSQQKQQQFAIPPEQRKSAILFIIYFAFCLPLFCSSFRFITFVMHFFPIRFASKNAVLNIISAALMFLRVSVHARSRLKVLSYWVKEQQFSFRIWCLEDARRNVKFPDTFFILACNQTLNLFYFPLRNGSET